MVEYTLQKPNPREEKINQTNDYRICAVHGLAPLLQ